MSKNINFAELAEPVARKLFGEPNPHHSSAKELRFGERGSLKVDLELGVWHDFEAEEKGGLLDLVIRQESLDNKAGAMKWLETNGFIATNDNTDAPKEQKPRPKIVKTYDYVDEAGELLSQVVRYEPKDFRQRKPNGKGGWEWKNISLVRKVPYCLPRLIHAEPDELVFITEGEKDADNLNAAGLVATCNAGGANKWNDSLTQFFEGRRVVILPDNDEAGRSHIDLVAGKLQGVAASVKVLNLSQHWAEITHKGDVSDWLAAGHTASELLALVNATPTLQAAIVPVPANDNVPPIQFDEYTPFQHVTGNGKPKATIPNLEELLQRLRATVRYNVIKKENEILIPGKSYSIDNRANAEIAEIISYCNLVGMPTGNIEGALTNIADRNQYNPVLTWINSKPWDGVKRWDDFCNTITPKNVRPLPNGTPLHIALIRRWMISAIAAAANDGISAQGVLVLQGEQNLGKTQWFKSLAPSDLDVLQDGVSLRVDDKDSVKQAVSYWLVELGELDATFKRSDIAALKAFLTRNHDELRQAYARKESKFPRRTVFFGSVNPREFLHDETGNRRYWTIECASVNHEHGFDMQQVWAEISHWYKANPYHADGRPSYTPTLDEFSALNASNEDFHVVDPITEKIKAHCTAPESDINGYEWMIPGDVLVALGWKNPNKNQRNIAANALRDLGLKTKSPGGVTRYLVPRIGDPGFSFPDKNIPF